MARKRNDTSTLVEVDPDTGETLMLNGGGMGGGMPPPTNNPADFADGDDTTANRKTADLYWQMLGEGEAGQGYVTVHYLSGGQGSSETSVARYPSDKHTLDELIEDVRTKYSARLHPGKEGDYRVRLYAKSNRGSPKIVGNRLVTILAPDVAGNLPAAVSNDLPPYVVEIMRSMRADSEKLREELKALAAVRDKPGRDFIDVITALAPIVVPFAVAAMNRPKDDPLKSLTAALTLTGTIRDMRQENDAPPVSSEESAPWWAPPLMQVIQQVPAMLAHASAARPLPAAPSAQGQPAANPIQPPPPPLASQGAGNPSHPYYTQVSALVDVQDRADPEEVAAQIWGNSPPQFRDLIVGFLTGEDAYATLAAIHPGVLKNPGFWADLMDALQEASQPVDTPSVDTQGADVHGTGSDNSHANT